MSSNHSREEERRETKGKALRTVGEEPRSAESFVHDCHGGGGTPAVTRRQRRRRRADHPRGSAGTGSHGKEPETAARERYAGLRERSQAGALEDPLGFGVVNLPNNFNFNEEDMIMKEITSEISIPGKKSE
jgi:hypothetical protein